MAKEGGSGWNGSGWAVEASVCLSFLACQLQPPPSPHKGTVDHSGFGVPDEERERSKALEVLKCLHPGSPISTLSEVEGTQTQSFN